MLNQAATAVVARNETWEGACATEPYECAWAREALLFVRALEVSGPLAGARARVQVSPDGILWLDEGTSLELPSTEGAASFARVREFGHFLRLAAELPAGAGLKVLVTLSLKG